MKLNNPSASDPYLPSLPSHCGETTFRTGRLLLPNFSGIHQEHERWERDFFNSQNAPDLIKSEDEANFHIVESNVTLVEKGTAVFKHARLIARGIAVSCSRHNDGFH
ncbi:hypothetical protein CDAR_192081 [Caerostris darwini]|uniref:Uncharacterized protein n=1 Tax=Caerostris darwini TaxID=1538125 RepID=A0AAV4PDV8_9ARAC|nr:hypothetical protein CDAR_192081 [Caerostris darwini]